MRRHLLLALALPLVAACGGDDEAAAPCDLLPLATARQLVGDEGIERIRVADLLPDDAEDDLRACLYAPPGTELGDNPRSTAGIQIDRGLYDSKEHLQSASQVGELLEGIGEGAIIEEEKGGYTVVVLVDDELSFALVARSPDVERDDVIELAKQIESKLS